MVKILSDLRTHISNNPMPPPMKEVFVNPSSAEESATYRIVSEYIMSELFRRDLTRIDLVLQLDDRIAGIGIFRAGFNVVFGEIVNGLDDETFTFKTYQSSEVE